MHRLPILAKILCLVALLAMPFMLGGCRNLTRLMLYGDGGGYPDE